MSNFENLVEILLNFEGGYVDHPNDTGGATNFGISLNFMILTKDLEMFDLNKDGTITKEDTKLLTKDIAIKAYEKYFWKLYNLDDYNIKISLILFDMYVNHRPYDVNRMIQKALNNLDFNLKVDGFAGMLTKNSISNCDPNKLAKELLKERKDFYYTIVKNNPSQKVFLDGWINHRIKKLSDIVSKIV